MANSLLPEKRRNKTRTRARAGTHATIESLLEFREDMDDWKSEGVLMQAYAEQAADMMFAVDTLRRYVSIVRNYSAENLYTWVDHGIGFDHMETANALAEKAGKTPEQLLNECYKLGNGNGETMTVAELEAFALGERPTRPWMSKVNMFFNGLSKLSRQMKWPQDKIENFSHDLQMLKERYFL